MHTHTHAHTNAQHTHICMPTFMHAQGITVKLHQDQINQPSVRDCSKVKLKPDGCFRKAAGLGNMRLRAVFSKYSWKQDLGPCQQPHKATPANQIVSLYIITNSPSMFLSVQ